MSDNFTDSYLTEALRGLPVPVPSTDFDDRILAALRVPASWWRRLWQPLQPLLLGASASCGLTLLLLHLTLSAPPSAPPYPPAALSNIAAVSAPLPSVDALLDRPNLCAGSLASAWNSPPAPNNGGTGEAGQEPVERRPEPRRHAEVSRRPALVA